MKKGPFGRFGVDVDNGFEAYYVVDADKKKKVSELKRLLKGADELYLATDEDREGEAIAWHLLEVLQPKVPVKRMVFHEITKEAIQRAANATRDLDAAMVDAQETRRILDRLYGYEVCPVLWRKVKAGPVRRSRAVRRHPHGRRARARADGVRPGVLLGRRGRLHAGRLAPTSSVPRLSARSTAPASPPAATSPTTATLKPKSVVHLDEETARTPLRPQVISAQVKVTSVQEKPYTRRPVRTVHDEHPPAGGVAQAAAVLQERDARRPAALRERLHHLHAHRQHHAVGGRPHRGPPAGARPVWRRSTSPTPLAATRRRSRTPRRPTRPSVPRVTGSAPRPRWPASCAATSSPSTS